MHMPDMVVPLPRSIHKDIIIEGILNHRNHRSFFVNKNNTALQTKNDTITNRCGYPQLASIRLPHHFRVCLVRLRSLPSPSPKAGIPFLRITERMCRNSEAQATMVEIWG